MKGEPGQNLPGPKAIDGAKGDRGERGEEGRQGEKGSKGIFIKEYLRS